MLLELKLIGGQNIMKFRNPETGGVYEDIADALRFTSAWNNVTHVH